MSYQCPNKAVFSYMWPGHGLHVICAAHAPKLVAVANAMGMGLQLAELDANDEQVCSQKVPAENAE